MIRLLRGNIFSGMLNGQPCYAAEVKSDQAIPESFSRMELRQVFRRFESDFVQAAGLAGHLLTWHQNHRYCSRCGKTNEDKEDERAKICPSCGLVNYPRLSPAIIVAVVRDGKLLLAHSPRFPEDFYSVLAGFVAPGETLEDCVRREVFEEVGISVKTFATSATSPGRFPIPSCWVLPRNTRAVKLRKTVLKFPTRTGIPRIAFLEFLPKSVLRGS